MISVHEASIKTATVEVKALTISGKQVTLSVFRQLKNEPILNEDTAELYGDPWGTVNYFFGYCKPDHLHVVWQKGSELRRACVFPDPACIGSPYVHASGYASLEDDAEDWAMGYVVARIALLGPGHGMNIQRPYSGRENVTLTGHGKSFKCELPPEASELAKWKEPVMKELFPYEYEYVNNAMVKVPKTPDKIASENDLARQSYADNCRTNADRKSELIATLKNKYPIICSNDVEAGLSQAIRDLAEYRKKWNDQYAALSALDHLFIAV